MIDFLELILELVNVKSRNELVALLVIGGVLAIICFLYEIILFIFVSNVPSNGLYQFI